MNRGTQLRAGCGQRRFATEIAAEKALARSRALPGGQDDGRKVKRCNARDCRGWHLVEPTGDTGPDRATREAVYERDGYACVCCGGSILDRPHSVGHRKRRSQGGTSDPSNLITLLGLGDGRLGDDHHARIDARLDPHDEARGFTVRSHEDPALVPVMIHGEQGGALMYLTDDFEYSLTPPEAGAA